MKMKITLLELTIVWLACFVARSNGKVVGNINNDDDGGTLTIVDIEDDNKTHYFNQNFELGNYNYGYDVKPSGPVGQFHHENRGIDEVVYGCYGYEGPDSKNHMTFYVSDAWGYRPVRQGQDIEVFYPAENPEGTGHHNGHTVKWADLLFPDMCANVAERIASSSNVVTKPPVLPALTPVSPADRFVTTAFPSTLAPSVLSSFGSRNTPVPAGSFDVIQFNAPSTIGPQPTSGRLQTVATGVPSAPTTQQAQGTGDVNSPVEQASNNNIVPNVPSSPGTTVAVPFGGRPTTLAGFPGSRFSTGAPSRPAFTSAPSRPAFTGGIVETTGTPSFAPLDITDSQSSNDGPILPNRGGSSGNRRPVGSNTPVSSVPQFSRLIPTPTEPSLSSEQPASNVPTGQTFSNTPNNRFVTTRAPAVTNFNLLRTTTTPTPLTGQSETDLSNSGFIPGSSRNNEVPVQADRAPGRQPSGYLPVDDDDNDNAVGISTNRQPTAATSTSSRVPSRGTTIGSSNPTPTGTVGTTRNPTGSTLVTEPASSDSTFPSSQPSTNPRSSIAPTQGSRQPTTTTAGVTGTRPFNSGFSGLVNNPGTLQPSSTNQQTVPGSTSGTGTPSTFNPTGPSGTATPNRFSTTFRQNVPTTVFPQDTNGTPSAPSPTTRGSSTFSTRSPSAFPTSAQFGTTVGPASTLVPLTNATSSDSGTEEFCASQCSSCRNNQPTTPQQPQQPPTLTDEDFLQIPGALLSSVPVIFYPDCSANAYTRPAVVPFCPSQKTQCNNQPLTMRFPDASNFVVGPNGPLARNAFVVNANQGSNRVTRKVRRGRQSRLATH